MKKPEFNRLLRQRRDEFGRPMTIALLAQQIGSERSHVNRVLLDYSDRHRGKETRQKIADALTLEEIAALGWTIQET